MSRRQFAAAIAGLISAPVALASERKGVAPVRKRVPPRQPPAEDPQITPIYNRSIVIDCLASPASFNVPWPPPGPLTSQQLQSVRLSGMTAVNVTVSGRTFEETIRNIALWQGETYRHRDLLMVREAGDIISAKKENKLGLILGFQDGEIIGRDLSLLDLFYNLGVRIIQPTYNIRNLLGDGCLEPGDAGLSSLGREAVHRMIGLGIALDLSHCGSRTTADGIAAAAAENKPVLISHTGCRAVYNHPRNKEDRHLRSMADHGGVAGIYLMPYLGNGGTPYASTEMFLSHLKHALNICGSDHVGIGSDQSITPVEETPEYLKAWKEGGELRKRLGIEAPDESGRFPYVPELNSPRRLELIAMAMNKLGYAGDVVEKVLGRNFQRVFQEAWVK